MKRFFTIIFKMLILGPLRLVALFIMILPILLLTLAGEEQHRAKQSAAKKGQSAWNKNIPRTNESREKQSITNKGKPWSPARRNAQLARQNKI